MCAKLLQLCLTLCDPWTVAYRAPLSMGFSRQEYWSGLPFPPPWDLPNPETEPKSPATPTLSGDSLPLSHLGSPIKTQGMHFMKRKRLTVLNAADSSNNIRFEVSYRFGNWDKV